MVRVAALIHDLEVVRLHRRFLDSVGCAETMLEIRAGAKVLELRLHHCAEVAGRVVSELENSTRIALEYEHHASSDLRCWKCHNLIPVIKRNAAIKEHAA
jgi:hypothetical protein